MSTAAEPRHLGLLLLVLSAFALLQHCTAAEAQPAAEATATVTETTLSDERVVFQTNWGDIEFAFLPHVSCPQEASAEQQSCWSRRPTDQPCYVCKPQHSDGIRCAGPVCLIAQPGCAVIALGVLWSVWRGCTACGPAVDQKPLVYTHLAPYVAVLLQVAPVTAQHIFKLVTLGAYTGNHIFRSAT